MSDIDDLLADVNAEQCEFEQTIWPPASADAIARLRRFAREMLQTDLPEDYVTFLGRHDGLDFNGHVIYGGTEHKEPFLSGFVEANERLGGPQAKHVYYGDTGDQLTRRTGRAGRGSRWTGRHWTSLPHSPTSTPCSRKCCVTQLKE